MTEKKKKYEIIYADCPWKYRDEANSGKRGVKYKYPVLNLEDIQKLPVQEIAADNCILFLWATGPLLPEIFTVLEKWGFEYKTVGFNWVKSNKGDPKKFAELLKKALQNCGMKSFLGSSFMNLTEEIISTLANSLIINRFYCFRPFFGMGNWTRSNVEFCLIGIKGKPKRISAKISQVVVSAIGKHSRKPDEVRDKILELVGELPRIELFATQEVEGWDSWGNDVSGEIEEFKEWEKSITEKYNLL